MVNEKSTSWNWNLHEPFGALCIWTDSAADSAPTVCICCTGGDARSTARRPCTSRSHTVGPLPPLSAHRWLLADYISTGLGASSAAQPRKSPPGHQYVTNMSLAGPMRGSCHHNSGGELEESAPTVCAPGLPSACSAPLPDTGVLAAAGGGGPPPCMLWHAGLNSMSKCTLCNFVSHASLEEAVLSDAQCP